MNCLRNVLLDIPVPNRSIKVSPRDAYDARWLHFTQFPLTASSTGFARRGQLYFMGRRATTDDNESCRGNCSASLHPVSPHPRFVPNGGPLERVTGRGEITQTWSVLPAFGLALSGSACQRFGTNRTNDRGHAISRMGGIRRGILKRKTGTRRSERLSCPQS